MSEPKTSPIYLTELRERILPYLQQRGVRTELAKVCGVKHRQQIHRWFPNDPRKAKGRLTAPVVLAVLRWLEERSEKSEWRFVPTWPELRTTIKHLIGVKDFVPRLVVEAGGISKDQIYSYFSSQRRTPDGEFTLRVLKLLFHFRTLFHDPSLGPRLRQEDPGWRQMADALATEEAQRARHEKCVGRRVYLEVFVSDEVQSGHDQTPSDPGK